MNLVLGTPEVIYLVLIGLISVFCITKHRDQKEKSSPIGLFLTTLLFHGLYFWGGFYDTFELP